MHIEVSFYNHIHVEVSFYKMHNYILQSLLLNKNKTHLSVVKIIWIHEC